MNYEDSSSDDVPYLPPDQFKTYEQVLRSNGPSSRPNSQPSQSQNQEVVQSSKPDQRKGRSYFTEDELRELDSPVGSESSHNVGPVSSIPRPPSPTGGEWSTVDLSQPTPSNLDMTFQYAREPSLQSRRISWGRRTLGIFLVTIPAVLFSVAVHFVDWSMSDFQLFSASFFIFQGIFWPSFGMLLIDQFCLSKARSKSTVPSKGSSVIGSIRETPKWLLTACVVVHSNLTAATIIFLILSIQRMNISVSLALSFGFDVVVILIQYISKKRSCSLELLLLSIVSYCGYGAVAIPAFISSDHTTRNDTAVGVGASVGVLLLCIPSSFLLSYLRKHHVSDSVLGTSTAFFGCIHALITKEIMGAALNVKLETRSVGWAAGLISVVFLGTIFLFLEARLSTLIWQRDDDTEKNDNYSSITKTRLAVFMLSCLWELARQGFRDTAPDPFDILGGFLVMLSFLLSAGFQAWFRRNGDLKVEANTSSSTRGAGNNHKFFAFLPWLLAQRSS
ncbi:unnamed protein product [Orchesella dallaii]|uniref:Uncharacterized protein n=1 Tax=Orchesella dallaii TaxID=48710 RepID=A0ABP1QD18_9HEXA